MCLLEVINPGMQESHCECAYLCFSTKQLKPNTNPCIVAIQTPLKWRFHKIPCLKDFSISGKEAERHKSILPRRDGGGSAHHLGPQHQMGYTTFSEMTLPLKLS